MRSRLFPAAVVCLFCSFFINAQTVDENTTELQFGDKEILLRLAVNSPAETKDVKAEIEFLDPAGAVKYSDIKKADLSTGRKFIEFRFPSDRISTSETSDLVWYRLRYRIGNSSGIISLPKITKDLFELRVIADENLRSGTTHKVIVRTISPFDSKPVPGVEVLARLSAQIRGSDKEFESESTGFTDNNGFVSLAFEIPAEASFDRRDADIKVAAKKNGIFLSTETELSPNRNDVDFLMMTDKPLYQPGQSLNIRGILFKGQGSKTVLTDTNVEIRIEDEDNTLLYREKVRTSAFGVAAISWQIPSNAKLGEYQITVLTAEDGEVGRTYARVSRYDLPNFTVTAKPSKPFYLISDKAAEIKISGNYLFGKPVVAGKVRVVEETEREWNYSEQKYDIEEGETREGELDASGMFNAVFDLAEIRKEMEEDDDAFVDKRFTAYLTDATTNRTEQRHLRIRVSREPIHIYMSAENGDQNPDLPVTVFFSTYYADGTPVSCDLKIKAAEEYDDSFKDIGKVRTNSFGVAKFVFNRPKFIDPDEDIDLKIFAKDAAGKSGSIKRNISFDDDPAIKLQLDWPIYKPGESVTGTITSTVKTGSVYIDIIKDRSVIYSFLTELHQGGARIEIPFKDNFKGEMKIAAYMADPEDDEELITSVRGFIFPSPSDLKINAEFNKPVYKPNEDAVVTFSVANAAGKLIESALGIVIIDRAVEERASSDSSYGDMFRGLGGWLGYGVSFAGVNVKDLNDLDLSKPISAEMQTVAEAMFQNYYYAPEITGTDGSDKTAVSAFSTLFFEQFDPIKAELDHIYNTRNYLHPTDIESLDRLLAPKGLNATAITDPWGTKYRIGFEVLRENTLISFRSAGPDKAFDTDDDFHLKSLSFRYFTPLGNAIDTVIRNHEIKTGGPIRDQQTLLNALGVRSMNDIYGRPYQFTFEPAGRWLTLRVRSLGPDGVESKNTWSGDDFEVWSKRQDTFSGTEARILAAQGNKPNVALSESEFRAQLREDGFGDEVLVDAGGEPLYIVADTRSRFWDRLTTEIVYVHGTNKRTEKNIVTPLVQDTVQYTFRSPGEDKKRGTSDDITIMQIIRVLKERTKDENTAPVVKPASYQTGSGSIAGTITDSTGAVIANVSVTALDANNNIERSVSTSASGRFFIDGLREGVYSLRAEMMGFKNTVIEGIRVTANFTVNASIVMEVGDISLEVSVVSDSQVVVNATSSSIATNIHIAGFRALSKATNFASGIVAVNKESSTPRLREYFPETLLWRPEVITGTDGRSEVSFKMADNITTWKMYAVASTKNGKVGLAEKEVTAFQSFFADLDPPKFLTVGDEIFLPVQIRNYTEKQQQVDVSMSASDWFSFIDTDKKKVSVPSGRSANAVFGFRAESPVQAGKQRVTAIAESDSDAIEKPVTVRHNGNEVVSSETRYMTGNESFELNFPVEMIPKSASAELKIYPNLMAHVAESVEGLLIRPYGCGEQMVSSTYPNLMILKFAEHSGNIRPETLNKARKYLQAGYERLLGYQAASGGFSYWGGKDAADLALTAYALKFLNEASGFIETDKAAIGRAENWLLSQQQPDGRWDPSRSLSPANNEAASRSLTTYIVRTLAIQPNSSSDTDTKTDNASDEQRIEAVKKALALMRSQNERFDDPYSLALLGNALFDSGDIETAGSIADRLSGFARKEGDGNYWHLQSNTVFNGWGTAGRIETTALVVQLLIKLKSTGQAGHEALLNGAMTFLFRNKDRYGVWYSTQTTINVLDAFIAASAGPLRPQKHAVEIIANGRLVKTIEIEPDKIDQISLDLTDNILSSENRIEVKTTGGQIMARLVKSHYVPWPNANVSGRLVNDSRALEASINCDNTTAAIMQEITCDFKAERVGFKGYGMLLAEVGLPPGADVDRETLDREIEDRKGLSKYELLPDRIVLYFWAQAGGTKVNFKFKPRYGINAQTPATVVYDYYNPEATAALRPMHFTVK